MIDELLAEQAVLQTPVARFSNEHDRFPDHEVRYRSLIPLTKPGKGEQYAFEVALDRCTGCKACVSACHSLNGLDDHETWRDAGVLLGGANISRWQQTITTACHHCEDPGCMNGCPVGAYEKDEETGIVRHLDDQCIGCSYCILKCPYDVPKYSKKRGIVRKCDMCHHRLAEGEAPACVQACPTEAIRIVTVDRNAGRIGKDGLSALILTGNLQSAIPDSSITFPTTRYTGREIPDTAFAADRDSLVPQHAHWPLVFMLVLTQAGMGLVAVSAGNAAITLTGSAIFFAGMAASILHLGQPLKAWRFFLGLRTSWLSREILAFSLFAPIPLVLSAICFLPDFMWKEYFTRIILLSVLPVGIPAVFTSVMIYHDTHRSLWRFSLSGMRFFGTVAQFAFLGIVISGNGGLLPLFGFILSITLKLIPEIRFLRIMDRDEDDWSPDLHSARLQLGPLGIWFRVRLLLVLASMLAAWINPWLAVPVLLAADLIERMLFFRSVHAPKMPGNFGPLSFSN